MDFGAACTKVVWANPVNGKAETVRFDGHAQLPTLVYEHHADPLAGWEAYTLLQEMQLMDAAVMADELDRLREGMSRCLDPDEEADKQWLRLFFGHVVDGIRSHCGNDREITEICISVPTGCTQAQVDLIRSILDGLGMVPHLVAQLQKQRKGELGHRRSAVSRHIAHGDAPVLCRLAIHHIIAGGQHAHQLHRWAGIQNIAIDNGLVGQSNGSTLEPGNGLLRGGVVVDLQLTKGFDAFPAQIAGVDGIAVQNYDLHKESPLHLKIAVIFVRIRKNSWSFVWN